MSDIERIINSIQDAYKNGFCHFGVRMDSADKKIGQYFKCSHETDENGNMTRVLLNGTCATLIPRNYIDDADQVEMAISENRRFYDAPGRKQYIVAGTGTAEDRDGGAIVINNSGWEHRKGAKVIAIVD